MSKHEHDDAWKNPPLTPVQLATQAQANRKQAREQVVLKGREALKKQRKREAAARRKFNAEALKKAQHAVAEIWELYRNTIK